MTLKVTARRDKIIDFARENVPKYGYRRTKALADYSYDGLQISTNAQNLERIINEMDELSSYLRIVVATVSEVEDSFGSIYGKVFGGIEVSDEDVNRHYASLVNLTTLRASGIELAKKYKEMDKDAKKYFSYMLRFMEKKIRHVNKIFS